MNYDNNNGGIVMHGTTVLSVRRGKNVIIVADGQVSVGNSIFKKTASKVKRIADGDVITGFAGATADAFTLFERLEAKLQQHPKQLTRACVELAKDWRTDKYLRRLEAMMIVADVNVTLVVSGTGDVIEPEDGVAAIGSGGNYALAAARALFEMDNIPLRELSKKAMHIAADICVFTNHNIVIEEISENE